MVAARLRCASVLATVVLALVGSVRGDFIYDSFNDTTGLEFNGYAVTTSCEGVDDHSVSYLQTALR